jgi:RsiW-degrading membrane proteinase PrsW (M82 family)
MKNIDFDKMWVGVILGALAPLVAYLLYYWVVSEFELRRVNVSLCMVANLLPFYLSLNREKYNMTKGVLVSTLLWSAVIAYLSFFTNYLHAF